MTDEIIWAGSRRRISVVFTDKDTGEAFDPDEVYLVWTRPDTGVSVLRQHGTAEADQNIEKTGTGAYRCPVLLDSHTIERGVWRFRWYSEGNDEDEGSSQIAVTVRGGVQPPA